MGIYKRKSQGTDVWYLRYRDADGKMVRRSSGTQDKEEAAAMLAEAEAEVARERRARLEEQVTGAKPLTKPRRFNWRHWTTDVVLWDSDTRRSLRSRILGKRNERPQLTALGEIIATAQVPDREAAYGRWLTLLARNDALDASCNPGERATEDHLREFVAELQDRMAPVSVSMIVGALLRMFVVLEPQRDWRVLAEVHKHLKRTATPSRDKLSRMVPATDLLALGIRLMETWADFRPQQVYKASQFRDGLMIALLICCPLRLRNLTDIVIGQHLLFDGRGYRLEFTAAETKSGRSYHAAVPPELTAYVDDYLRVHRPRLQTFARVDGPGADGRLWLGRLGKPLSGGGIQKLIVVRTTEAFGQAIYPHLFRDIAVTELVDFAPDEIAIAPDLLGHADLRTTRKHYIQAQGMVAHLRVQEIIAARRRAATSRNA